MHKPPTAPQEARGPNLRSKLWARAPGNKVGSSVTCRQLQLRSSRCSWAAFGRVHAPELEMLVPSPRSHCWREKFFVSGGGKQLKGQNVEVSNWKSDVSYSF